MATKVLIKGVVSGSSILVEEWDLRSLLIEMGILYCYGEQNLAEVKVFLSDEVDKEGFDYLAGRLGIKKQAGPGPENSLFHPGDACYAGLFGSEKIFFYVRVAGALEK